MKLGRFPLFSLLHYSLTEWKKEVVVIPAICVRKIFTNNLAHSNDKENAG
jgi:hypothetical protein